MAYISREPDFSRYEQDRSRILQENALRTPPGQSLEVEIPPYGRFMITRSADGREATIVTDYQGQGPRTQHVITGLPAVSSEAPRFSSVSSLGWSRVLTEADLQLAPPGAPMGQIYAKRIDGIQQLFFRAPDGTERQITDATAADLLKSAGIAPPPEPLRTKEPDYRRHIELE